MLYSFSFTAEEVNLLHDALMHLPMKAVEGLVVKVRQTVEAQSKEAEDAAKAAEAPPKNKK